MEKPSIFYISTHSMNVEAHVFVSMTQTLVPELRRITEDESGI